MKLPRWTALILLLAWALHGYSKVLDGIFPEMLWGCHMATLVIVAGIATRSGPVTAIGFLFHVAAGFPGYLIYVANNGIQLTSVFIHSSSLILGALALRPMGWPRWAPAAAWAFNQALVVLSYFLTDPTMNINMAHAPFKGMETLYPQVWMSWLGNAAVMALTLWVADYAVRRWWVRVL